MRDLRAVAAEIASLGLYFYTDANFDPVAASTSLLRSDFVFGRPGNGFLSPTDRIGAQNAQYEKWVIGLLDLLEAADSEELQVRVPTRLSERLDQSGFGWIGSYSKYQGGRWVAWRSAQRCWTLRGSEALGSMASIHRPSLSVPLHAPVNGYPLNLPNRSYKRVGTRS